MLVRHQIRLVDVAEEVTHGLSVTRILIDAEMISPAWIPADCACDEILSACFERQLGGLETQC